MTTTESRDRHVIQQLDALFEPWNRTDEPGLVVGIVREGELIYRRGFGMASLEHGRANTPATRMRIGSVSKHFTALLALLLAEEGRLDLDAPIRNYIPELVGPGGEPSARQLLQHRGGSRCYLDLGFIAHGLSRPPLGWPLRAQVQQAGRNFAPGEAMIYNNGGYHLVSLAIERVGGAPFEQQLEERLFNVVGMPDTQSVPNDHTITPGVATFHLPASRGRWRRGLVWTDELRGEGAIISTVDDMLRWMAHLRTRHLFGSPASWAQLIEQPRDVDGAPGVYALGLLVGQYRGLDVVHHSGVVSGGTAQMLQLPRDGLDVILMANGARDAVLPRLSQQIVDIVLSERVGPATPVMPSSEHAALLGDWWSCETGMVYSLIDQEGALALSRAKAPLGVLLEARSDGSLFEPAGSLGEVALSVAGRDALSIRFGSSSARYGRLNPSPSDAAVFNQAAIGSYFCPDIQATAQIRLDGGRLMIRISDSLGEYIAPLIALSGRVAWAKPEAALAHIRFTITLEGEGGGANGFKLFTPRTRNLGFKRLAG